MFELPVQYSWLLLFVMVFHLLFMQKQYAYDVHYLVEAEPRNYVGVSTMTTTSRRTNAASLTEFLKAQMVSRCEVPCSPDDFTLLVTGYSKTGYSWIVRPVWAR